MVELNLQLHRECVVFFFFSQLAKTLFTLGAAICHLPDMGSQHLPDIVQALYRLTMQRPVIWTSSHAQFWRSMSRRKSLVYILRLPGSQSFPEVLKVSGVAWCGDLASGAQQDDVVGILSQHAASNCRRCACNVNRPNDFNGDSQALALRLSPNEKAQCEYTLTHWWHLYGIKRYHCKRLR